MWTQCQRKWGDANSQEVGLEAAILERVRNSSLVESPCADNGSGLKSTTDAADGLCKQTVVGERSPAEKRDREDPWSQGKCECRYE